MTNSAAAAQNILNLCDNCSVKKNDAKRRAHNDDKTKWRIEKYRAGAQCKKNASGCAHFVLCTRIDNNCCPHQCLSLIWSAVSTSPLAHVHVPHRRSQHCRCARFIYRTDHAVHPVDVTEADGRGACCTATSECNVCRSRQVRPRREASARHAICERKLHGHAP